MAKSKRPADPPPDTKAEERRAMCGLGAAACRKALEANGDDLEIVLAALIDARRSPGDKAQ